MGRWCAIAVLWISLCADAAMASALHPGEILIVDYRSLSVLRLPRGAGPLRPVSNDGLLVSGGPIAVESTGTVVVGDLASGNILRIDPDTGGQTLVASGPKARNLVVEPSGSFLVLDWTAVPLDHLTRVDPTTGALSQIPWPWTGLTPWAIAVSPQDRVLLLDPTYAAERLLQFDPATGIGFGLEQFHETGNCYQSDLAVEAAGTILVLHPCPAEETYSWIERRDPPQFASTVVARGGDLRLPNRIALGPDGGIFVIDTGDPANYVQPKVLRVDPTSGAQSVLYNGVDAHNFWGLTVSQDGRVFLAGGGTDPSLPPIRTLYELYPQYPIPSVVLPFATVIPGGDFFVGGMLVEPGGTLAVAGVLPQGQQAIVRSDPGTGVSSVLSAGGLLTDFRDFVADANGDMLVIADGQTIARIDGVSGAQSVIAQGGLLQNLRAIARSPQGGLYVLAAADAQTASAALVQLDPARDMQTEIVPLGTFVNPQRLLADAQGRVVVSDAGSASGQPGIVWRVTPSSRLVEALSTDSRLTRLSGLALDRNGDILLTTSRVVYRLDPETGTLAGVSPGAGEEIIADAVAVVPDTPTSSCGVGVELAPLLSSLVATRRFGSRRRASARPTLW